MAIHLSKNLTLTDSIGVPLNHARIGYDSVITTDSLTGTEGQSGFPLSNIVVEQTFEKYKPATLPAIIFIDAGTLSECNYIGLVGTGIGLVTVSYSTDNLTYTDITTIDPLENSVSMGLFVPTLARYWRITFSEVTTVTNIKLGKALEMERAIYGGHSPLPLSARTVKKGNVSETGQWLGRTVQRRGFATDYSWSNLTARWYRSDFQPFVEHAKTGAFYISWNPLEFPNEVGYCWCQNDIQPSNMGVIDLMNVSVSVEGYDVYSV